MTNVTVDKTAETQGKLLLTEFICYGIVLKYKQKAVKVFLGNDLLSERGSHRLKASLSSDHF